MTREEKLAYQRGYAAGAKWPDHRPPYPPELLVRQLMVATRMLRDEADAQCATLSPDDEFVVAFDKPIERVDDALEAIGKWLKRAAP